MTRQPTATGPNAVRNRTEARKIWQVAKVGSGQAVRPVLRERSPLGEKVMPISDLAGIAPKMDSGDDRTLVFLGWPRIFPGI